MKLLELLKLLKMNRSGHNSFIITLSKISYAHVCWVSSRTNLVINSKLALLKTLLKKTRITSNKKKFLLAAPRAPYYRKCIAGLAQLYQII
jgi:hypothetical protein